MQTHFPQRDGKYRITLVYPGGCNYAVILASKKQNLWSSLPEQFRIRTSHRITRLWRWSVRKISEDMFQIFFNLAPRHKPTPPYCNPLKDKSHDSSAACKLTEYRKHVALMQLETEIKAFRCLNALPSQGRRPSCWNDSDDFSVVEMWDFHRG